MVSNRVDLTPKAADLLRSLRETHGPLIEYWRHTHLTVDVVPGRGSGFSVEAPEGVRFMIRSRLLTDEEVTELDNA
jgi:uncharacterized protein (DUF779 family)